MLPLLILAASLLHVAVGVVCDQGSVKAAAGLCAINPASLPCRDGITCQCVSALFNFCGVSTNTMTWVPGAHVLSNCGIAPYTAIATFYNGVYDWRGNRGHTGIFLRCVNGGFQMWDQWCGNPMDIRFYPLGGMPGDAKLVFRTDANSYFVVQW